MSNDKAFKVKNGLELAGYDTTKAVTAVDVFVYDTSKDSDGGAWRKRTQGTSWYNETLDTATRGSRREFPAVAVIVAEADTVTIYDGDDPSLPMWMVFNRGSDSYFLSSSQTVTSLSFFNGSLVFGTSSTGIRIANFVGDFGRFIRNSNDAFLSPVVFRNAGTTFQDVGTNYLVNATVNDVAMTVLPDAPIDPATGLPVPTIAVATAGGVSVIKDNGTVVDSTATSAHAQVDFFGEYLFYSNTVSGTFTEIVKVSNISGDGWTASKQYGFSQPPFLTGSSSFSSGGFIKPLSETSFVQKATTNRGISIVGNIDYATPTVSSFAKDMVAYTTSTYNTGWMNGDIKGAFLSDTDDTDLVGSGELVTNSDFATNDLTGWTDTSTGTGTADASTGAAILTGVDTSNRGAITADTFATVIGQTYTLALDVSSAGTTYQIQVKSLSGNLIDSFGSLGGGKKTYTFVADRTTAWVYINVYGSGSVTFDNISVKLADADRSVNNNGLIVNGTVTRTPVATGADLVAYSGFSASNYLEQPYNADLDFGTGDFCVMGWAKGTSQASFDRLFERSDGTSISLQLTQVGATNALSWRVAGNTITTSSAMPLGVWFHFCAVRRGGVGTIYINGISGATGSQSTTVDLASATTVLGNSPTDLSRGFNGSLALWRISATAPTANQIAKIYNDEKFLFQENAQATLYGASDAVTALAHDDATGLLHVGTSAGRSVFQGLRRVSNTTTAVGTAISASNGMIAEE